MTPFKEWDLRLYLDDLDPVQAKIRDKRKRRGMTISDTKFLHDKTWIRVLREDPCVFCGGNSGTVDHIKPRSKGGLTDELNLVGACSKCNQRKGNKDLLYFLGSSKGSRR